MGSRPDSGQGMERTPDSGHVFTYVRIPWDDSLDVEELSAEALGYAGDALPNLTAKSFASSGSDGSGSSSATSNYQTARILAAASSGKSETFALVHPSSTNGGRGVYMYVDEVGRLKCKPPNVRATTLANQCALMVDGDFCGDVFVGAVTVNPRTVNVSFAANELNPNAPWLLQAPMENQAYSAAMADFRNAVEAKKTKISEQERAAIEADRANGRLNSTTQSCEIEYAEEIDLEDKDCMTSTDGLRSYFQSLSEKAPVRVGAFAGRGNGISLTRDVSKGEMLWAEAPLVSAQTFENAEFTMACAWCHRSVGTIETQLDLAAGRCSAFQAASRAMIQDGWDAENDSSGEIKPLSTLPGFEQCSEIPKITPCRHRYTRGCPAVYCSGDCMVDHAGYGHDVACCGLAGNGSSVENENKNADENENQRERAAVVAAAAFRRDCGHHDNLKLVTEMVGQIAAGLSHGEGWVDATKPFRGLVGGPWWDVSGENSEETSRKLQSVAARSAALLKASAVATCEAAGAVIRQQSVDDSIDDTPAYAATQASYATTSKIPTVLDKLGLPGFAHLLGICDLNQWSLRVDGPMRNVTRELLKIDEHQGADSAWATLEVLLPIALDAQKKRDDEDLREGRPRWGGDGDEVDEDDDNNSEIELSEIRIDSTSDAEDLYDTSRRLFPMFTGQALFGLLCLVNHSCTPSTVTRYSSWRGRTMVRIEALRDIAKDEELSVSYVDETEPVEKRREALAAYGFVCICGLCVQERAGSSSEADDVD